MQSVRPNDCLPRVEINDGKNLTLWTLLAPSNSTRLELAGSISILAAVFVPFAGVFRFVSFGTHW
jgi:hypothetical protein